MAPTKHGTMEFTNGDGEKHGEIRTWSQMHTAEKIRRRLALHTHKSACFEEMLSRAMDGVVKGRERERRRHSYFAEIFLLTSGNRAEREYDGACVGDNEKHSEEFKIALS
jgi:hypothetical protein